MHQIGALRLHVLLNPQKCQAKVPVEQHPVDQSMQQAESKA
jgi:hypothetical protein